MESQAFVRQGSDTHWDHNEPEANDNSLRNTGPNVFSIRNALPVPNTTAYTALGLNSESRFGIVSGTSGSTFSAVLIHYSEIDLDALYQRGMPFNFPQLQSHSQRGRLRLV